MGDKTWKASRRKYGVGKKKYKVTLTTKYTSCRTQIIEGKSC
jgi:hypothetical protein